MDKPANEESGEDSSSEMETDDEEQDIADLAGYTGEEQHRPGIIALLNQMFRDNSINSSKLADFIIEKKLGTVIILNEDEDEDDAEDDEASGVFAVTAALDLRKHQAAPGIKELKDFLEKQIRVYGSQHDVDFLEGALKSTHGCIFLVNEKMINLPPEFTLVPLQYSDELDSEDDESGDTAERDNTIICVLKLYKKPNEEEFSYMHPEHKVFVDHSIRWVDYPVNTVEFGFVFVEGESEDEPGEDCPPFRRICFISSKVFRSACMSALKEKIKDLKQSG